MQTVLAVYEIM